MIVRLTVHPRHDGIVVAFAPPNTSLMGGFEAARYDPDTKGYLIEEHLTESFGTYLKYRGARLLDTRHQPSSAAGPLPQCRTCGRPASRRAALTLDKCACGAFWDPVVHSDDAERARREATAPNEDWHAAKAALTGRALPAEPGAPVRLGDVLAPPAAEPGGSWWE